VNAQDIKGQEGIDGIAPIRTPDEFIAGVALAFEALNEAMVARFSKSPEAVRIADRAERIALAVHSSPFLMRGDEVVAKGFVPRIV
jgi:hypothetical protein